MNLMNNWDWFQMMMGICLDLIVIEYIEELTENRGGLLLSWLLQNKTLVMLDFEHSLILIQYLE